MKSTYMELLGSTIINEVRDKNIDYHFDKVLNGKLKSKAVAEVVEYLATLSANDKEIIKRYILFLVDNIIFDMLKCFDEDENFFIGYNRENPQVLSTQRDPLFLEYFAWVDDLSKHPRTL